MLTQERLKSLLFYNPESGRFMRLKHMGGGVKPGDIAGYDCTDGHRQIQLEGVTYREHMLVWLYVYGKWPDHAIVHANGDKSKNTVENLKSRAKKRP